MNDWIPVIQSIPTELWGTLLLLALLYKVLDWWRKDVQRMDEAIRGLTGTVDKLNTLVELTQFRRLQRMNGDGDHK